MALLKDPTLDPTTVNRGAAIPVQDDQFDIGKQLMKAQTGRMSASTQDAGAGTIERLTKQSAGEQIQQQEKQIQTKALELGSQMTAQKEGKKQTVSALQEQALNLRKSYQEKARQIMQTVQGNKEKLSLGRYKASIEQLGFYLRMQDKYYTDKIQEEGKRARLESTYDMEQAQQMAVFSEERDLLQGDINFKRLLAIDERTFQAEISRMSIDQALALATASSNANNSAVITQAIGSAGVAGIQAYGSYLSRKE